MTYFLIYAAICAPIAFWIEARKYPRITLDCAIAIVLFGWAIVFIAAMEKASLITVWRKHD